MDRVISGERVVLRPVAPRDLPAIRRLGRTPTSIDGFPQPGDPADQPDRWLRAASVRGAEVFAIDFAGEALGVVTVEREGGSIVRVGYHAEEDRQGRGLTAEALGLVVTWLFRETAVHRVELGVTIANVALWRAAQRAGFVLEGVARARCRWAGVWHDVRNYALLRDEWEEVHGSRSSDSFAA